MGPQHVGANVLFNELASVLLDGEREKEVLEAGPRLNFDYCLLSRPGDIEGRCQRRWRNRNRRKRPMQSIGEDMVLLRPLIGHEGFRGGFQHLPVASGASANKGNKEIATRHQLPKK